MTKDQELYIAEHICKQGDCHIWTGFRDWDNGEPIMLEFGKIYPVSRIVEAIVGEPLNLKKLKRKCDNKLCVNPDHYVVEAVND